MPSTKFGYKFNKPIDVSVGKLKEFLDKSLFKDMQEYYNLAPKEVEDIHKQYINNKTLKTLQLLSIKIVKLRKLKQSSI